MTADELAEHLAARRVGTGRWTACCPAHEDRSPSLSVRVGRDGRALLHCFGGCSVTAILKAAGLQMCDLFAGPPPSPAQARELEQERSRREAERRRERRVEGAKADRVRKLAAITDSLFERAARMGDGEAGDKVAALAHDALRRLREAEQELEAA